MKQQKTYLYFSKEYFSSNNQKIGILENGSIVLYTSWEKDPDHVKKSSQSDLICLGEGKHKSFSEDKLTSTESDNLKKFKYKYKLSQSSK